MRHIAKFHADLSKHYRDTAIFDFQDTGVRHLGFSNLWNFNGR